MTDPHLERLRRVWARNASAYDRQMRVLDRTLFAGGREWVCARAQGDVLEIAIGTGRNLGFYPGTIRLTGIDLSPETLGQAQGRVRELGLRVGLVEGDAQRLPFADSRFDTIVSTLSMCEVPDMDLALAEMRRVLRRGGRLVLLDHVRSTVRPVYWLQRAAELLSVRYGGDHQTRRPLQHVEAAGFRVIDRDRRRLGVVERLEAVKGGT